MSRSDKAAWAIAVTWLVICTVGPFLVFTLLDTRLPNDHDDYYTAPEVDAIAAGLHDGLVERTVGAAVRTWGSGQARPQGIEMIHAAFVAAFGPSLTVYRLANLPFLLLLVGGMLWVGVQVLGRQGGVLAAFVVATLPVVLNQSRKVETQFHSTAIAVVALGVCLYLLRNPRVGLKPWLALGLVQGLRCYTHPIALPDIVAAYGALAGVLLLVLPWDRETLTGWGRGWALAAVTGLAIGGRFLFGSGAPSLRQYMDSSATWLIPGDMAGVVSSLAYELGRAASFAVFEHLFLPVVLLFFVPALLLAPMAVAAIRSTPEGLAGDRGRTWLFLVLLIGAQAPIIVQTLWSGAYMLDWIALVPPAVVLGLATLQLATEGRSAVLRTGWIAALVLLGSVTAWLPLAASAGGPDPLVDPAPYEGPIRGPFLTGEKFTRTFIRHYISRSEQPTDVLVPRMLAAASGDASRSKALLGTWDLLSRAPRDAACLDPEGRALAGCCNWDLVRAHETNLKNQWPFLFGGFAGLEDWETPEPSQARFHVVRLRVESPPDRPGLDERAWWHQLVTDECLAEARVQLAETFAREARIDVLPDPAHQVGDILHNPVRDYVGTVLVVDRGSGRVVGPPP